MGNKKPTFTQDRIFTALKNNNGRRYLAARELGCHTKTIERAAKKYAEIQELLKQYRGERVDTIEDVLWKKAAAGEPWAVCFFLKTQAKDRGYTERYEHTGEEGSPIKFIVEVPPRKETAEEWVQQYQQAITDQKDE